MAYLNSLLPAITEPSGFWINIIKAFEGGTKNYVLAVILLTIVIRVIWSIVDTFQKWTQQKQGLSQAKMQPELEKLKVKYAKQPQILQQKQNELQRKYMGKGMYGSCLVMLVIMVLNLVIFFTLFSSLNAMASFKTATNYESIKYSYANSLNVIDAYLENGGDQTIFADYENLSIKIEDGKVYILDEGENLIEPIDYKDAEDFTTTEPVLNTETGLQEVDEDGNPITKEVTNKNILLLVQKYFDIDENVNITPKKDIVLTYEEDGTTPKLYLSQAIQNVAMTQVEQTYEEKKDSFLWIQNIWISDSPMNQSIVGYDTLVSQIGNANVEAGEQAVYNSFMPDLKASKSTANGYLILPILCVLASVLTTELSGIYNRRKNKKRGLPPPQKQGKLARILMPCLLGVFALFYNSVFAIYMLTGQLVSAALLIPQLIIVDKIVDHSSKKQKEKEEKQNITVDYTRKF